ncbi:tryptophan-rich sensory protein [Streptomyces sp. NPDC020472]|uniref:tryptophan-rich sensory protein n=1 Tax=Streptomyces sp. NPDC020472 TaxID=3365075 RepID=UPI0037A83B50
MAYSSVAGAPPSRQWKKRRGGATRIVSALACPVSVGRAPVAPGDGVRSRGRGIRGQEAPPRTRRPRHPGRTEGPAGATRQEGPPHEAHQRRPRPPAGGRTDPVAARALWPYAAWCAFATALNASLVRLDR